MWINQVHIIHPCLSPFFFSIFVFVFGKSIERCDWQSIWTGTRWKTFISSIIGGDIPLLSTTIHYSSTVPPLSPSIKPFPVESFCLFATPETSVSASVWTARWYSENPGPWLEGLCGTSLLLIYWKSQDWSSVTCSPDLKCIYVHMYIHGDAWTILYDRQDIQSLFVAKDDRCYDVRNEISGHPWLRLVYYTEYHIQGWTEI